jgi:hypothetical protein
MTSLVLFLKKKSIVKLKPQDFISFEDNGVEQMHVTSFSSLFSLDLIIIAQIVVDIMIEMGQLKASNQLCSKDYVGSAP